ncbi:hypothetical protein [Desulfatiglans anilini]|uniref:hypothetical protein n=1 Tax=Desulfatiglans anilini TaxID=90728 RepID=UPI0012947641|nr:hypothetical protein [Desulfatiglans anilini]
MKKIILMILILPLCCISCAATIGAHGTHVDVVPPLPVTVVLAGPYYFSDAYYPYYYCYYDNYYYYYYSNRWYYSRYRHSKHTYCKPLPSHHYPQNFSYKSHRQEYNHKKYKDHHNNHKKEHRNYHSDDHKNKKRQDHEKKYGNINKCINHRYIRKNSEHRRTNYQADHGVKKSHVQQERSRGYNKRYNKQNDNKSFSPLKIKDSTQQNSRRR